MHSLQSLSVGSMIKGKGEEIVKQRITYMLHVSPAHPTQSRFYDIRLILENNYVQFSERDTLASMRTGLLLALGLALLAGTQAHPREVTAER